MVSERNTHLAVIPTSMSYVSGDNHSDPNEGMNATVFLTLSIIVVLIGLVGNSFNFILFSTVRYRLFSFAVYVRILAVSDSFVLLVNIIEEINSNVLNGIFFTTRVLCNLSLFITFFGKLLSSLLVIAVAVDRYIAVVYPLHRNVLCTLRRANAVSVCLVLLSASLCLTAVIWHEAEVDNNSVIMNKTNGSGDSTCPNFESEVFDLYGTVIQLLFVIVGPVCVVSLLNVRVLWAVKSHVKLRALSSNNQVDVGLPVKMTVTLVATTLSSVIFHIPLIIVEFMEFGNVAILDNAWRWTSLVQMLNYALNFYIIVIHGREYRQALKRAFGLGTPVPRSVNSVQTYRTLDGTVNNSTCSISIVST
ncbi:lysophosphatidic acid receptor 6-like [Liolophura sinensis]|uniref:lysophosphatidic acid receptor 6-like n=1 Tax=Liolophura sinensis TaxID=3198878 RepID=UPI00315875A8